MKAPGGPLGYGLGTAAVIALLLSVGTMQNSPTWLLPLAALVLVVVMPIVLGIVLARRAKQRAGTSSNQSRTPLTRPCSEMRGGDEFSRLASSNNWMRCIFQVPPISSWRDARASFIEAR